MTNGLISSIIKEYQFGGAKGMKVHNNTNQTIMALTESPFAPTLLKRTPDIINSHEEYEILDVAGSKTTFKCEKGECTIEFLAGERRTTVKGNITLTVVSPTLAILMDG